MVSKEELKREIKKLISTYEKMNKDKKSFSEADVQTKLIKPLFGALGWDIKGTIDPNEVKEEKIDKNRKRADLIFNLDYDPKKDYVSMKKRCVHRKTKKSRRKR